MTVPKLRFPAFQGAEDWEDKTLGSICDYWNGASHESSVTENGQYYLISLNSIDIGGNLKSDMKRLSSTDKSLQKNDLVMVLSDVAHGNFLGLTDIIPNDSFILNQRMAGLRLKKHILGNVGFLRAFINLNQKYFKRNGQGSSQLNLSKSSVTDFPFLLPSPIEQQKIADCLCSIDSLIAAETQKLDTLKAHKKGLMQQLFPAEGETLPKLRFPEFRDAGEWEDKTLGSICDYWNGASHESSIMENGQYYLISLNSIDIAGNLKSDMKRLSSTDKSLQENDLVMVLSDVAHGNFLGLTDIIPNDNFVLNQRMARLRLKKSTLGSVSFLRAFINFNQKYFKRNGQGSSQLNLSKSVTADFDKIGRAHV